MAVDANQALPYVEGVSVLDILNDAQYFIEHKPLENRFAEGYRFPSIAMQNESTSIAFNCLPRLVTFAIYCSVIDNILEDYETITAKIVDIVYSHTAALSVLQGMLSDTEYASKLIREAINDILTKKDLQSPDFNQL